MNIAVLVKQVPDTVNVEMDKENYTLIRDGVGSVINPFDTYAIEEALRIKESLGGTVTALSMGPMQAEESLREAISMGVDNAFLLSDKAFAGADTLATSRVLSCAIKKVGGFDLIICGKQTVDGDTGQVGPEVAEHLDIPHVTCVRKISEIDGSHAVVERMTEEGYDEVYLPLPGLITVVKEINVPRVPSLKGKMRAKNAQITVWGLADLGLDPGSVGLSGSPTKVVKAFRPEVKREKGEIFEGSPEEQVAALVARLKEMKIV